MIRCLSTTPRPCSSASSTATASANATSNSAVLPWISPLQYAPRPSRPSPPSPPPEAAPPASPRPRYITHADAVRMIAREPDPQRALDLFNAAAERQRGFAHNNATYAAILHRLASTRRFRAVDALLRRMRLEPCRFEEGALLNLMRHFARAGLPERALAILHAIPPLVRCPRPSARAFASCLNLLVEAARADLAGELLCDAERRYGVSPNACMYNILVKHHCRAGNLDSAFRVLTEMREKKGKEEGHNAGSAAPNRITYSTLMGGLCSVGKLKDAFQLFEEMIAVDGIAPDALTYNVLIDGFCRSGKVDKARQILGFMRRNGYEPNVVNYSTLMNGFAREGRVEEAREVFEDMRRNSRLVPDAVSYTTLISCLCKNGRADEGIELVREMREKGCKADVVTFNVVISGLCKEGRISEAMSLLEKLPGDGVKLNKASYRIVMNSLCSEREMERAVALLSLMFRRRVVPHFATSNELLVKLCEAGKVAEVTMALYGLVEMGFMPEIGSWIRMVESISRKRKLSKAFELLDKLISTV